MIQLNPSWTDSLNGCDSREKPFLCELELLGGSVLALFAGLGVFDLDLDRFDDFSLFIS